MIECDASDFATGAILSQQQDNGTYRPIAFLSTSMTPAERNYDIHDKELLAIIQCFEAWRLFLLGYAQEINIFSDHQNLTYFWQPQDLTRRQARWTSLLQDYNFKIHHRKGALNKKADLLSRWVDHEDGDNDNKNTIALPGHLFALLHINIGDREEVLRKYHDDPIAGHPGRDKMFQIISHFAIWDTLREDITKYIEGCSICQENKPKRGKQTGQLHPHPIPPYPWHTISVDLIGPLPESQGHDAILTIVDKRTKHPIFIPTTTTLSSEGWARALQDNVFRRFGLPHFIISDRGSIFVSKFIKELYDLLGIKEHPLQHIIPKLMDRRNEWTKK
jgi:RNase H-like domain found in reverse transcriptase/Integrase zinc binding domain